MTKISFNTAMLAPSPYLQRLAASHAELIVAIEQQGFEAVYESCLNEVRTTSCANQTELMKLLRVAKNKLALLVALADISGHWPLEKITHALSIFAEKAVQKALNCLLTFASDRGEIVLKSTENPSQDSGIIILGMGKLGAYELNYSSDIDLIVFFEKETLQFGGRLDEQKCLNKIAQDLVTIMQERTNDGYVFRTDLRLRPDPASTPPAISTLAAYYYYESVGQNWERAAMIKARPIAGDIPAGERFLKGLTPYMWRKSLDFAAINDIHSIKRQMDTRQHRVIKLAGHNIKLGLGGIREIEFYVQIHQLIWGGRKPDLRSRGTCETLIKLEQAGLIENQTRTTLIRAYGFLRMLEHRLQMVADAQTHSLPETEEALINIAHFAGFKNLAAFEKHLLGELHAVHDIYRHSFQSADNLGSEGNLVFTGVSHDPQTITTLSHMGYKHPETVAEIVMGWHHGSKRCTRTKRARELLTELMPALLKRLAETANPDAAFIKFNDFLTHLPAAIQLFSLFQANKQLLGLIADIMGSAPSLADTLSKSPELIENVLFSDFYNALPNAEQMESQAKERTRYANDTEDFIEQLTRFRNEKQFQAGVHFLRGMIHAQALGAFLADVADVALKLLLNVIQNEFQKSYGKIAGAQFAIISVGKAGSREMTFSSDLDLVFIYSVPDFEAVSDGEKGFTASVYYNRFSQRLMSALTSPNRAGKLYEVDTRLRPSGKQGLLAVSTNALSHYFEELAWTFEYMAFTKARAVVGDVPLMNELGSFIANQIKKPRNEEKLKLDVADMREKMAKEFTSNNIWDIKNVRGGLVDIDFLAQFLLLKFAPHHKTPAHGSAHNILMWCKQEKLADTSMVEDLLQANFFLNHVFHLLRLCVHSNTSEADMPLGLQRLLCASMNADDFESLKKHLIALETQVYETYLSIL